MNSLQQLNAFSNEQLFFTDDRPFSVTATTDGLPQTGISVVEDTSVGFSAFGVTITKITGADDATSDHITLTFDFSSATNPKINWPTAPNNVVFNEPTPGVFVASQIQFVEDYEFILNNTTVKLVDQVSFLYTVNASWPGISYTQTFNALMTTTPETNLNGLALNIRDFDGHPLFDLTQINPSIVDNNNDSTYDLQLTSSLGATLSIGPGTPAGSINITGDKPTVDAALDTVYYYPIPSNSDQTDTINYTLTVTNGTLGNYVSESGSFTNFVPAEVLTTNFDNIVRNYTENTVENYIFQTGSGDAPEVVDLVDPNRTYTLTFTSSVNTRLARQSDSYPYNNNTLSITGTPAQINAVLSSTTDPIKFIPDINVTATETITWQLYDSQSNPVVGGSITVNGVARTTPIAGEGLYSQTSLGTRTITVTDEMMIYGQIDVLINSSAGDGGFLDSYYAGGFQSNELAASSSGADGGLIEFTDQDVFTNGGMLPGDSLILNFDNLKCQLQHYKSAGGVTKNIIIVEHGGDGGAGDLSQVLTNGRPGANSGGGGAYWIDGVSGPWGPPPYWTWGSGGGVIPNSWTSSYFTSPVANLHSAVGSPGSAGNNPSPYAIGGFGGTVSSHTSSITGTSVSYRTVGGSGGSWDGTTLTQPGNGQSGEMYLRIKQK